MQKGLFYFVVLLLLPLLNGCAAIGFHLDRRADLAREQSIHVSPDTLTISEERVPFVVHTTGKEVYRGYLDEVVVGSYIVLRENWGIPNDARFKISWEQIEWMEKRVLPKGPRKATFPVGALVDTVAGGALTTVGTFCIGLLFIFFVVQ